MQKPIAIVGAGSWGTALAIHLAQNQQSARLWTHDPLQAEQLQQARCNERYLPGYHFPESLTVYSSLSAALADEADILIVVPSGAFRDVLERIKSYLTSKTRLAFATKGIDPSGKQLLSAVCVDVLGSLPLAVLSGPSFAREVAAGLPTAISLSCEHAIFRDNLLQRFHHGMLRVYANSDLISTQVGGAVKNVLAIAAGISDGLGFGANAKAALITRGLVEMKRLALALGGQEKTVMGLAGLGDLILTCTDNQSRNRRFGLAVGQGIPCEQVLAACDQVVEGYATAHHIFMLAKEYEVEMPIVMQVYKVLYKQYAPAEAVAELFSRLSCEE